jgi:prepilin-type N-terminal cleavage/methylation domain-containing protein
MYLHYRKKSGRGKDMKGGFSLIELMVSLTIFSILMVVSVGTLLTLIDANAKAQALSSATTNLSFALDSITREIRTGHYYRCEKATENPNLPGENGELIPKDCSDEDSITFIRDRDGHKIGYRLKGGRIEQQTEEPNGVATEWEVITSTDIEISKFSISVTGSETYNDSDRDTAQPTVTLHFKGGVKDQNGLDTDTNFNIQTQIVQRRLDQV